LLTISPFSLALTSAEKAEILPSGSSRVFDNRLAWSNSYLKKAGLITSEKRGTLLLTQRGKKVLQQNPKKIDNQFLKQFPEFITFLKGKTSEQTDMHVETSSNDLLEKTPEELLEHAHQTIKESLAHDILERVFSCSPEFFERLVIDLLIKMGYGGSKKDAGKAVGRTGDGGIDGIIKEDKLGLDIIYIQAKRWKNQVPLKEVRDFAGALLAQKAKKGIFITTSNYTPAAYDFVKSIEPKIILIDGKTLAEYMIENNVGTSTQEVYEVKRVDLDYFEDI